MKEKKVEPEITVKIKDLRAKVQAIQKGVKSLKTVGVEEKILTLLIQKSAQRYYKGTYGHRHLGVGTVKAVLKGMENLEKYIFEETKNN